MYHSDLTRPYARWSVGRNQRRWHVGQKNVERCPCDLSNRRAAHLACQARTVVHEMTRLKITRTSVSGHEITQCRATGKDRFLEGFANGSRQGIQSCPIDFSGPQGWADASAKQALACVDVAHADYDQVIHQQCLDTDGAFPGRTVKLQSRELAAERFDAKTREERVRIRVACVPKHGAESPRIAQPKDLGADDKVHMVMGERRLRTRHDAKAARHAQMDDQSSPAAIDQ
jgi:hypothetical protein